MELNTDVLISFFKDYSKKNPKKEFTEQETGAAGTSTGGGGKSPRQWSSGRKFGKTYMNDPKYVWKSDTARSHANALFFDV